MVFIAQCWDESLPIHTPDSFAGLCAWLPLGRLARSRLRAEYFKQFQSNSAMDMVNRLPGFVFEGGMPDAARRAMC
jgi:hypothetical protein